MTKPRLLKRTQERTFSAHHMLLRAADRACDVATENAPGSLYDKLVAITLSALAMEALCNTVGERIVSDWQDFESSSPIAKLRLLAQHLAIDYRATTEPWESAQWLVKFRNKIAHAKPELVIEEIHLTQEQHDKRLFDIPESKLEKQITLGNAKRAVKAVTEIKRLLSQKVPPEHALGLYSDGWSGTTKLTPDA